MGYSIELYFDPLFEEKIYRLWDDLAKSGVPSILQQIGSRPHLSLAVLETIDEIEVPGLLEGFIRSYARFFIEFNAFGLIPGDRQAVFLAPVPGLSLLEMQQSLYRLLHQSGYVPVERYKPDKWLPHCTISKELSPSGALQTIEICQNWSLTGTAGVVELGVIEFRPRREIQTLSLKSEGSMIKI